MKKIKKITMKLSQLTGIGAVFMLVASHGYAASALTQISTPLQTIQTWASGPLAGIIAAACILGAAFFLMFSQGDNSALIKKISMIVLGIGVIVAISPLLQLFGLTQTGGALIGHIQHVMRK